MEHPVTSEPVREPTEPFDRAPDRVPDPGPLVIGHCDFDGSRPLGDQELDAPLELVGHGIERTETAVGERWIGTDQRTIPGVARRGACMVNGFESLLR